MKWAGRILLIVLIASTLFVAKQNNFQTETALAQTGSTQNLTLNLNDIEVRVVKNDNSSSTTAGSAIINSQTTAVYFNKVKVTNNSNQDIYFRITAQLYYGTIPGPCAIPGGSLCTPPNQYRVVSAGQTLTLPDNTFLLPGSMFSFLSGQYPFQTLALQGINKADLKFILSEAGYASTNVTKIQILKWSAVRIKLQNGAGVPVGNKRVGLFKEGESNTQPPPDQWRYGNTNAAGQVAMALLDPITTLPAPPLTYTARYVSGTNPQDYTDLPPPVVVTGPDFQDLTFTICDGGTGGQGFLVERAQAQTQCKPDLIADTSALQAVLVDEDKRTFVETPPSIKYGSEIDKLSIRGLKIKNIGTAVAQGSIQLNSEFLMDKDGGGYELIFEGQSEQTIAINIAPGQSITLPDFEVGVGNNSPEIAFLYGGKILHMNTAHLRLTLDSENVISELDENNNQALLNNFITWPAILIKVTDANGQPYSDATVFATLGDGATLFNGASDQEGEIFNSPLRSLRSGPYDIYLKLSVGGNEHGNETVSVSDYSLIHKVMTVGSHLRVNLPLESGVPALQDNPFAIILNASAEEGTVVIKDQAGKLFEAEIDDGMAIFDPETHPGLGAGTYSLSPFKASVTYEVGKEGAETKEVVSYQWPESTRSNEPDQNPNQPPSFQYDGIGTASLSLTLLLAKSCENDRQVKVQICWYDDPGHIQASQDKKAAVQVLKDEVKRYKTWPQSPLTIVKNIKFIPYITLQLYGQFPVLEKNPNSFNVESRNFINDSSKLKLVADHEMFHALDYEYADPQNTNLVLGELNFLSMLPAYTTMIDQQLGTETGSKLWDMISWNCAYNPDPSCTLGYSVAHLSLGPRSTGTLPIEALAEEKATTCLFKDQVVSRLNNIEDFWRQKQQSEPPADLLEIRDLIRNRLAGKDRNGQLISQHIANWQNNCLTH